MNRLHEILEILGREVKRIRRQRGTVSVAVAQVALGYASFFSAAISVVVAAFIAQSLRARSRRRR